MKDLLTINRVVLIPEVNKELKAKSAGKEDTFPTLVASFATSVMEAFLENRNELNEKFKKNTEGVYTEAILGELPPDCPFAGTGFIIQFVADAELQALVVIKLMMFPKDDMPDEAIELIGELYKRAKNASFFKEYRNGELVQEKNQQPKNQDDD